VALLLQLVGGAAAGGLASLAFPPARAWPLLGVALAMLFGIESRAKVRRATAVGAAFFLAFSLINNSWVGLFGIPAWTGLTVAMAGFGAAQGALGALLARAAPSRLAVSGPATAWVLVETVRMRFPFGGFPWGLSAHALAASPFRDLAPLGGPLLMGAVLAGGVAPLAAAPWAGKKPLGRRLVATVAGPAIALGIAVVAGWLPTGVHEVGTARVALVQAYSVDRDPTPEEVTDRTFLKAHFALTAELPPGLDLVAWGESSVDDPARDPELNQALGDAARRLDAPLLVNAPAEVPGDPNHLLNVTFVYSSSGELTDRYVKRHLLPFGEYVPFRRYLGWVKQLRRVPRDDIPGHRSGVVRVGPLLVDDLICFESADLRLARNDISLGAQLVVVTTNNRSFSTSPLSAQHVEVDRVLAESTRRTVLHAAVSGTSSVVLPDGGLRAEAPLFEPRSIVAEVPLEQGRTPYVRFGDWVGLLAIGYAGVLVGLGLRRRRGGRKGSRSHVEEQHRRRDDC
jgi:apolipoprotein N-acyltransferase